MLSSFLVAAALLSSVLAHGHHEVPQDVALFRRNNLEERHALERRCAGTFEQIYRRKMARRGIHNLDARDMAHMPRQSTCSMTGETTEGPYWIHNELFRSNVSETQGGVSLQLQLTILDVATCDLLPNVYVEIWHANATGYYSGFTGSSSGGGGGGGPGGGGPGGSSSGISARAPVGPFDGADKAGSGGASAAMSDELTFFRGVVKASSSAEAVFYDKVPGWYSGRAVHIHVRVWENGTVLSNGSFVSEAGSLHHTGQLFFQQSLLDDIAVLSPYSTNHISYADATTNDEDGIYPYASWNGESYADLETTQVGSALSDGLIGEITIVVNTTYVSPILSSNYYDPDD